MTARVRQVLPLTAWVAALAGALVAFTAMGGGQLAAPALTDPGSWPHWAAGRAPAVATAAVLRLVVLALAWYLLGMTAVGAAARVTHLTAVVRVADALSLPMVRRALHTALGVGLATAMAASSTTGAGSRAGSDPVMAAAAGEVEAEVPAPPRMRPLPHREGPTPDDRRAASPEDRRVRPARDGEAPTPRDRHAATSAHGPVEATTVTVRPGDHLWAIAEQHLTARGDRAPTDDEVAAHWRRLIDANRDRLVDPANPDLVLPGQRFVLPDAGDDARRRP